MKAFVVFIAFLALAGSAQAQTLNVKLTVNNVANDVYIPGTGEVASGSLGSGTTYSTPEHFYIASYLGNLMYALVAASGTSLYASNDLSSHTIQINQPIQGSRVHMGFTQGDYTNIENVIAAIEDGTFWLEIAPSLSFGVGYLNPVKVLLAYQDINITGNMFLHSGLRKITVSNEGFMNDKPIVRISSS